MKTWAPASAVLVLSLGNLLAEDNASNLPLPSPVPPVHAAGQNDASQSLSSTSAMLDSAAERGAEQYVSPWVDEVTKLVHANVETPVVLEFINGAGTFGLDSDRIISLNQEGVPPEVVAAMIQHDAQLAAGTWVNAPPPPVARRIVLRLVPRVGRNEQSVFRPSMETPSIVNPSPAPELWLEHYWPDPDPLPVGRTVARAEVREPVPVKLTSTIIVHRGVGKVPNNFTLEPLAETTIQAP